MDESETHDWIDQNMKVTIVYMDKFHQQSISIWSISSIKTIKIYPYIRVWFV
jgi:hypothetical protein